MCCFEFFNAGKHPATEYSDSPPVEIEVGMGTVDRTKPVIVFFGNNFLPAWFAVEHVKAKGLEDAIEICGVGAVGHDIPRFYNGGEGSHIRSKGKEGDKSGHTRCSCCQ